MTTNATFSGNGKRVLIVEDERIVALTLKKLLQSRGFNIIAEVDSGEKAVEIAISEKPDLLLMDIFLMGEIDGIEAANQILAKVDVPIIYLTANADVKTIERAKYTRPYGYILKPFDQNEIYRNVEIALFRHDMERKVRDVEAKNKAILNAIPDFLIKINKEGDILHVKVPGNSFLPFLNEEEILRKGNLRNFAATSDWLPGRVVKMATDFLQRRGSGKGLVEFEYDNGNASLMYFEARIVDLQNGEGLLLIREVTDQKEGEAKVLNVIIQTQEKERKRFAGDLHDGLGQILSVIKMNLDVIGGIENNVDPNRLLLLDQTKNLLDEAVRETRDISHSLMSGTLSEFGLDVALNELCNRFHSTDQVEVVFNSYCASGRFREEVEVALYRIAQELITNSIRHSHAKRIDLQLVGHDHSLVLTAEDDGKGFAKDEVQLNSGIGLGNIETRVNVLKGKFTLDSTPGNGTLATIEIPLEVLVEKEVEVQ